MAQEVFSRSIVKYSDLPIHSAVPPIELFTSDFAVCCGLRVARLYLPLQVVLPKLITSSPHREGVVLISRTLAIGRGYSTQRLRLSRKSYRGQGFGHPRGAEESTQASVRKVFGWIASAPESCQPGQASRGCSSDIRCRHATRHIRPVPNKLYQSQGEFHVRFRKCRSMLCIVFSECMHVDHCCIPGRVVA